MSHYSTSTKMDPALETRLKRLAQLGLIAAWEYVPRSGQADLLSVVTTRDDTWTGEAHKADAYLTGISHGAWAVAPEALAARCPGGRVDLFSVQVAEGGKGHSGPCPACDQQVPVLPKTGHTLNHLLPRTA